MSTSAQSQMPQTVAPFGDSDLPEGWTAATIGKVADVVGGGTPSTSDPANFSDDGHPWITPADLSDFQGAWIKRGKRGLTEKGLRTSSATPMPKGTVLMSSRAPIGYVAIAANPIATNQGFKSFVLGSGLMSEFCFYWLKFLGPYLQEMGSGSTFLEISGSRARDIPFLVAPTAEQQRIVTKIEDLLAQVNAVRARLAGVAQVLKRFRQAVLAAACSGRLTEDWRERHPNIEFASDLVIRVHNGRTEARNRKKDGSVKEAEELFETPSSWVWVSFGSVCNDITVGHVGPMAHQYRETGVPFLRSQNVREFRFDPTGLKYISREFHNTLRKSALSPGDVVVVRSGFAGVACVIPQSLKQANCADLVVIRPSDALNPQYACIFVNSNEGRAHVDEVKVGIAQSHFNIGSARMTPFPLPPIEEQNEIVRRVDALFSHADSVEKQVAVAMKRADKLTQAILAKAFRGELVPTEAELARREGRNYEPASVLLERIRASRERIPQRAQRRITSRKIRTGTRKDS